jgi:hypothetical protein
MVVSIYIETQKNVQIKKDTYTHCDVLSIPNIDLDDPVEALQHMKEEINNHIESLIDDLTDFKITPKHVNIRFNI